MNYVISDIHGEYDKFLNMITLIDLKADDTLYVLGDCIDRSYGGIKVLDYIKNSSNITLILGNHELMLMDYLTCDDSIKGAILLDWINIGGKVTIDELKSHQIDYIYDLLNWLYSLDFYKILNDDNFLLVHGGVDIPYSDASLSEILNYNDKYIFTENREFIISDNLHISNITTVVGHTSTISINGESNIIKKLGKIAIDCGCSFIGGRLSCLCLDTMEEFYVD